MCSYCRKQRLKKNKKNIRGKRFPAIEQNVGVAELPRMNGLDYRFCLFNITNTLNNIPCSVNGGLWMPGKMSREEKFQKKLTDLRWMRVKWSDPADKLIHSFPQNVWLFRVDIFAQCGGCVWQDYSYIKPAYQNDLKAAGWRATLSLDTALKWSRSIMFNTWRNIYVESLNSCEQSLRNEILSPANWCKGVETGRLNNFRNVSVRRRARGVFYWIFHFCCPQSHSVPHSPGGSGGTISMHRGEVHWEGSGLLRSSVCWRRVFTDQRIRVAAGGEIEETTAGVSEND